MAIGPFTPGFVGDTDTIRELAELGVIFLMFGVGLHFSLRDLWSVRQIALPGALLQMLLATGAGFLLTQMWGWSISASVLTGIAISIASTVVLLRGLMDQGLLNTAHGRVAVGWLVLEDMATVIILVVLTALYGHNDPQPLLSLGRALLLAAVFVGVMLFAGSRILPWLLNLIVKTRSRELFILTVVALALGIAVGSTELFGVSLALGAFLAGVVIGETPVSHQVGEEILPFRETFAVLFFVSVGMLVNIQYLFSNLIHVLALSGLIVFGKSILTILIGMVFGWPARTTLVVAAGLSQIGEFSFILGQTGLQLGLLSQEQYSLLLASSLLSIALNPLSFKLLLRTESLFRRAPKLWQHMQRHAVAQELDTSTFNDHVVVVGYGRVGEHIINVLGHLGVQRLVVEIDAGRAAEFEKRGIPTLYGDAANSEILLHTGLERARALVVTLPDETATAIIVAAAHEIAPNLPIIARAVTRDGFARLIKQGAHSVIHPELEGGLEVVRHTLLTLGYPMIEVQQYADAVRRDHYETAIDSTDEHIVLDRMIDAVRGMEVAWLPLSPDSVLIGRSLAESNIRAQTETSVIAVLRNRRVIPNPKSALVFQAGDVIGLIGDVEQLAAARVLIADAVPALATTSPESDKSPEE